MEVVGQRAGAQDRVAPARELARRIWRKPNGRCRSSPCTLTRYLMPFWLQMSIAMCALTYAVYMMGHTAGAW